MAPTHRMRELALAVCSSAFASSKSVPHPGKKDICLFGCYDWTDHITWDLPPEKAESDDYYMVLCTTSVKYKSIYICAQAYCSPTERYHGLGLLNTTCKVEAGLSLPSVDELALSETDLAAVPRIPESLEDATADNPISIPSIPDYDWIQKSWHTDTAFYTNFWLAFDFTWTIYGFWGLVILIGMVHRAFEVYNYHSKKPTTERAQASGTWNWIRRRLILPATFGKHCQEAKFGATIPPRLESLILFVFVLLNFVWCFPGYDLFDDNQYFENKAIQLSRYVADRTGQLSLALVPIMWVFSARNDPFLWLTGWSFATFNRFHRWLARISFVHAFIHSVAYSVNYGYYPGEYQDSWKEVYWYCGQIATILMALVLALSIWWFREKQYDFFLLTHIGGSIIFLVTLWYHLKEEYYDKYNGCLWPCVAIWCLDRLVRLGRIVYQSVIPRCAKGVKAVATFDKRSEMIRLDITDFFHKSQVVPPVQFYYVYTPGALKGYESHPFTLCSWNRLGPSLSSSPQGSLDIDPEKQITSMFQPVEETILSDQLSHSFLIRPYGGFTERLRDKINASHEKAGSSEITVFIEGPYGNTMDLSHYSDVLIIAGGSGITAAVSHAYHLLATGNTTIRLAWAVPQRHLVDNVCENELAAIVRNRRFYLDVYLTSGAAEDPEKPAGIPPYAVHFGRPDIYAVMRDARQKCTSDLAVVTCGTPAMADVCRAGVVRLLGENGANVAYFNETMLW